MRKAAGVVQTFTSQAWEGGHCMSREAWEQQLGLLVPLTWECQCTETFFSPQFFTERDFSGSPSEEANALGVRI